MSMRVFTARTLSDLVASVHAEVGKEGKFTARYDYERKPEEQVLLTSGVREICRTEKDLLSLAVSSNFFMRPHEPGHQYVCREKAADIVVGIMRSLSGAEEICYKFFSDRPPGEQMEIRDKAKEGKILCKMSVNMLALLIDTGRIAKVKEKGGMYKCFVPSHTEKSAAAE